MKTIFRLFVILCATIALRCEAQITPAGTFNGWLGFINTLSTGPKLISSGTNSFDLLEPDLSVYASVSLPPAPTGYQYNGSVYYITETLFDVDPLDFEFAIGIRDNNNNVNGTMVIRQDGTILFTDLTHVLGGGGHRRVLDSFANYEYGHRHLFGTSERDHLEQRKRALSATRHLALHGL